MAQTASEFYLPPGALDSDPLVEDKFRAIEDHLHSTRTFYTGTLLPGAKIAGSETDTAAGIDLTGGGMQSPNFVSGSAGWRMADSGNVEFFNGTFRGSVQQTAVSARRNRTSDALNLSAGSYIMSYGATSYNLGGGISVSGNSLVPARSGIYMATAYVRLHLDVSNMAAGLYLRTGSVESPTGGTEQAANIISQQAIGNAGLTVVASLRLAAGVKVWSTVTTNAQFDVLAQTFLSLHYLSED